MSDRNQAFDSGFDYDVAVIGGGSAGYAAANKAATAGLRTVVLEGGKELGGLCILRGCMPSKALLWAAEVRRLTESGPIWGLQPNPALFDWSSVMGRKHMLIREFAEYRAGQLQSGKFELIRATARFRDPHTVALSDGRRITARHFVVATGSVVAKPPLPQLAGVGYITSDEAVNLERLPKSLIVLGGGVVAVELAQLFARFDVEVTLIQRSQHILRGFDSEAVAVVEAVFRCEGIRLLTGTTLIDAYRDGRLKAVTFMHQGKKTEAKAEEILVALGRTPNTASLGLDQAGIQHERGRIITDEQMRTTASHIFAAGDCTSPHDIVHLAVQQAEIAVHNLSHPDAPRPMDYRLLTRVVFTDPQVAVVGLLEKEARERAIPYEVANYAFSDHGKSLIMEAREGFVRLLAEPRTGEILGGACIGPMGGELIHEIVAAMHKRMTVGELAAMPHYHPTLAEIWTYPAEELAERIQSSSGAGQQASAARV